MRPWKNIDPRVTPGSLVICGECHALRGRVPEGGVRGDLVDDGAEQFCRCPPIEVRPAVPVWGGDYNTYAELCRCCGLVLLASGSRYSVWFCQTCRPLVVALNRASGRCVVPIGRHSIMNGVRIRAGQLQSPVVVEGFVNNIRSLFASIGGLEGYARGVVARNLVDLGFEPGRNVYLGKYLWTVRRSHLTPQDGFAELVVSGLASPARAS